MRVYRLNLEHNALGNVVEWFPSRRVAERRRAEVRRRTKRREAEKGYSETDAGSIEAVEIPQTRTALVAWLNLHFSTDNG